MESTQFFINDCKVLYLFCRYYSEYEHYKCVCVVVVYTVKATICKNYQYNVNKTCYCYIKQYKVGVTLLLPRI